MSNIQGYLQNIMQAVYGKDVRQSIHDAIEMIDSVADTAKDSATASAKMAETMAENAGKYADEAQTCVVAAAASEANAKASETAVKASENAAKISADNAAASETSVAESKDAAAASEANAKASAEAASRSADVATEKAAAADQSSDIAAEKAEIATEKASEIVGKAEATAASATKAESYAVGGTGSREGEDTDNAAYYYRQAKSISESFAGALRPMGTVSFADLPGIDKATAGDMYNISDEFTTTDDFKEGSGSVIPAGANVYKTSDNKWDVLAGTPVTGVKGAAEKNYHRGNVNLTAASIGAVAPNTRPVLAGLFIGNSTDDSFIYTDGSNNDRLTFRYKKADGTSGYASMEALVNAANGGHNHDTRYLKLSGGDITGNITVGNNKVQLIGNDEGGNVVIFSPNGQKWELDAFSNTWLRLFTYGSSTNGNKVVGFSFMEDGTFEATKVSSPYVKLYGNNRIEANEQDVNIICPGKNSSAGYVNARVTTALQVRDTSNSTWKPINASAFNVNSSKRYKKNILDMSAEEARQLLKYRVVDYDYINEDNGTGCQGMIAEEVAEINEYPVYRNPDGTVEGLDYSKFVPQLIKMVQIQQTQIDALQTQIDKLTDTYYRKERIRIWKNFLITQAFL